MHGYGNMKKINVRVGLVTLSHTLNFRLPAIFFTCFIECVTQMYLCQRSGITVLCCFRATELDFPFNRIEMYCGVSFVRSVKSSRNQGKVR